MSGHTKLESLRKARKIDRKVAAEYLGLSDRHMQRIESGEQPIKRLHLLALASLYEVPLSQLEEGTEVAA